MSFPEGQGDRETLPKDRESLGGLTSGPGGDATPYRKARKELGGVGRPFRRDGWGREALTMGREGSGGPFEGPIGVVRGWDDHSEVRVGSGGQPEGLGGPPRSSGEVRRPTQRSGRGREAHLEVREGAGGPPKGSR